MHAGFARMEARFDERLDAMQRQMLQAFLVVSGMLVAALTTMLAASL